jgi:deoxyribodipyrimidine photolyase
MLQNSAIFIICEKKYVFRIGLISPDWLSWLALLKYRENIKQQESKTHVLVELFWRLFLYLNLVYYSRL